MKQSTKTVNDILASHNSGNGSIKSNVSYNELTGVVSIDNIDLQVTTAWLTAYAIYALQKDIAILAHESTAQALINANALSPLHYSKLIKNSTGLNFTHVLELSFVSRVDTIKQLIIVKSKGAIDITALKSELTLLGLQLDIVKETTRSGVVITNYFYEII
jgi:hypothetical protein